MKRLFQIPIITCVLLLGGMSSASSQNKVDTYPVKVSDIPLVYNEVAEQKVENSFATFIHDVESEQVNIQFSYDNGNAGLDWVLLAPRNVSDKEDFLKLAKSMSYVVKEKEKNGTKWLRIDMDESLPKLLFPDGKGGYDELPKHRAIPLLCMWVFKQLYGLTDESEVYLYFEGIKLEIE